MSLPGLRIREEALEGLSPAERLAVAGELRAVQDALQDNPLLQYNHPVLSTRPVHRQQVEFHRPEADGSWPSARLFLGGNRSGKTTSTMVDTIIQSVDTETVPEHLRAFKRWEPPFYARVVTPDLTNTLEGVVLQKFREWCPRSQLKGRSFDRAWNKVLRILEFKNGSWIQFFSNDQDLDKFGGAALHRVVYDEEPRQDIRQECLTRLIDYDGEELFGMTPLHGMSWVFDEFFEPWERGILQDARIVVVDMDDNPHLSEKGKARALAAYSGEEREARKSGRFVSFAGLIYPMFRAGGEDGHVIPDVGEIPEGAEVFEAIDPGMRQMAAVVFCYLTAADQLVVYDELALQGKTVKVVCEQIKAKRLEWGRPKGDGSVQPVTPRWTVIDPASRNKSPQTGRSDQQEYHDHGIFTLPGQNDVTPGINRVRERLEANRLHITGRCVELRREFKRYRWSTASTRTEDAAREKPVKRDDHLLDALRYAVMQRPKAPDRDVPRETDTMKDRILRHHLKRLGRGRALPDSGFGPGQWA